MYTNNATRKHPGLVILMIDQSGSMENAISICAVIS